jgi:anti-sigma factor RsiW
MDAPDLTCKDVIALLADYLESALGPELLSALERHLADCRACLAYLNTYRKTRELTGRAGRVEMPDEMKQRLRQLLLDHLTRRP